MSGTRTLKQKVRKGLNINHQILQYGFSLASEKAIHSKIIACPFLTAFTEGSSLGLNQLLFLALRAVSKYGWLSPENLLRLRTSHTHTDKGSWVEQIKPSELGESREKRFSNARP